MRPPQVPELPLTELFAAEVQAADARRRDVLSSQIAM
jgi:hypothetical protein